MRITVSPALFNHKACADTAFSAKQSSIHQENVFCLHSGVLKDGEDIIDNHEPEPYWLGGIIFYTDKESQRLLSAGEHCVAGCVVMPP